MNTTTQIEILNVNVEKGYGYMDNQQPSLMVDKRECRKCGETKSLNLFRNEKCVKNGKKYRYYTRTCKECENTLRRTRYAKHDNSKRHDILRQRRKRQFEIVINHYGGECVCCGEKDLIFLEIDHANNDGYKYRNGENCSHSNIVSWIVRNNFPEGFQILCANCHLAKHRNKNVLYYRQEGSTTIPKGSTLKREEAPSSIFSEMDDDIVCPASKGAAVQ